MTSCVHVAYPRYPVVGQPADRLCGIDPEEDVVMPGVAVGVHEDGRVGEVGVVVYDIGQVHHCFSAFILRGAQWRVGVVDRVDGQG